MTSVTAVELLTMTARLLLAAAEPEPADAVVIVDEVLAKGPMTRDDLLLLQQSVQQIAWGPDPTPTEPSLPWILLDVVNELGRRAAAAPSPTADRLKRESAALPLPNYLRSVGEPVDHPERSPDAHVTINFRAPVAISDAELARDIRDGLTAQQWTIERESRRPPPEPNERHPDLIVTKDDTKLYVFIRWRPSPNDVLISIRARPELQPPNARFDVQKHL